jgi:hypothetical protein
MAKSGQIELQLLRSYSAEVADLDERIAVMRLRRNSLAQAVVGLKGVLRSLGVDPSQDEPPKREPPGEGEVGDVDSSSDGVHDEADGALTIDHAVRVLRQPSNASGPLGAREIERLIAEQGITVNYYTLSKSLNREASKPDGRIIKTGKRFLIKHFVKGDPFEFKAPSTTEAAERSPHSAAERLTL